jgi:hypothetical protein
VFSKWRAQVRTPRGCFFLIPWLSVGLLLAPSPMAQIEHLLVVTQLSLWETLSCNVFLCTMELSCFIVRGGHSTAGFECPFTP